MVADIIVAVNGRFALKCVQIHHANMEHEKKKPKTKL